MDSPEIAYNFAAVQELEAEELAVQASNSGGEMVADLAFDGDQIGPARWMQDRFGIAFSGGGIRSACVALGITQGLAQVKMLQQAHYISAISGGGYLLGWLTACFKNEKNPGDFRTILADNTRIVHPPPQAKPDEYRRFLEPDPIHHLRSYSSYLTPRLGLFSGDTLAMVSIYLRNLLLNLTLLSAVMMALTLLLQQLGPEHIVWKSTGVGPLFVAETIVMLAAFIATVFFAGSSLRRLSDEEKPEEKSYAAGVAVGSATLAAAVAWHLAPRWIKVPPPAWFTNALPRWITIPSMDDGMVLNALLVGVMVLAGIIMSIVYLRSPMKGVERHKGTAMFVFVLAWLAAGALTLAIDWAFMKWLRLPSHLPMSYVLFGLPGILISAALVSYLFVGILGDAFPDANREWVARAAGYLLAAGVSVALVLTIALRGPDVIDSLFKAMRDSIPGLEAKVQWKGLLTWCLPGGWIFVVVTGVVRGRSPRTNGASDSDDSWLNWVVALAPPVFLAGMLLLIAWASASLSAAIHIPGDHSPQVLLFCLLVALAGVLGWRLDVNEFSMHLFYRNRLVRAFLGASNTCRKPSPFTGFASTDDMPLQEMTFAHNYRGPYPIWGTTLNMTRGTELAWQQRKGASFIYSPLFCGWDYVERKKAPTTPEAPVLQPDSQLADCEASAHYGYRSTQPNGTAPGYGGVGGKPSLGTAMAASGAAVSPNMGYHSRPGVAALLAIFNVRLGWWTGNPRNRKTWKEYAPPISYLLAELLGQADDRSKYVYLSDGGHFDNLGLYELVRRKVRLIICSDAGADGKFQFEDLGIAIERCRCDFGVEINVSAHSDLQAETTAPFRTAHYSIGEITYPGQTQKGILLYLKSSLTNDEPGDVLSMRASDRAFPHDSTGNQFFNESMFESYRALGQHMIECVLKKHLKEEHWNETSTSSPSDRVTSLYKNLRDTFKRNEQRKTSCKFI